MKIVFGVLMMLGAFPLLFWNEGRAVRTAESLEEGRGRVITVSPDKVDPANEGKLVHTTGRARTADTVSDPTFGVAVNAIALKRRVEVYQWHEKSESRGRNSDSNVYKYTKQWSDTLVDSSKFKVPDEHPNPTSMQYKSDKWLASKVTLGAFTLNPRQVDGIPGDDPVKASLPTGAAAMRDLHERDGVLYLGSKPAEPQVGDLRISFSKVPESDLSIVARQSGTLFAPYRAKSGATVDLQTAGTVSGDEMFTSAEHANVAALWGARIMGFILMAIGVGLMLRTFTSILAAIPFIGHLVNAGTVVVAVMTAAVLSLTTISIAWIFYRPLLGLALLVIGGGAIYAVWRQLEKKPDKPAAPAQST